MNCFSGNETMDRQTILERLNAEAPALKRKHGTKKGSEANGTRG